MLWCCRKGCQKYCSTHQGKCFFHFTDVKGKLNSKLTLCQILELVYLFLLNISNLTAVIMSSRGCESVTNWFNFCCRVCLEIVLGGCQGQMVGTTNNDEAYFEGRCKYNSGKLLRGDKGEEEESRSCPKQLQPWLLH